MQKYNEKLVEQVRSGKAQVQVDNDRRWEDLLQYIFPKRPKNRCIVDYAYSGNNDECRNGYISIDGSLFENLPIIHAKEFLVQEPEVKWVEVRNNHNQQWSKAILIADIGVQFKFRYFVVESGKEERFINGESNLDVTAFKYMREIPQPEPLTHSELEKLIGKPFKYVAE